MITKEKFLRYEGVRQSGVTNMFAINVVTEISGLPLITCKETGQEQRISDKALENLLKGGQDERENYCI